MSEPAIRFTALTLGYERHPAVHHLDGRVPSGSCLAVIGPNGAGKSTLLKGIVGEIVPLDGAIVLNGTVAYLPQAADVDRSFPISVLDLIGMGSWRRTGAWRSQKAEASAIAEAIAAVGLTGFEDRPIDTLSGGQFRRALFGRLILQNADVILLDEPFTGIDARAVSDLLDLIRVWHREGRTVLAALHDLSHVRACFPSSLLLARDVVAWGPTEAVLTPANLAKARNLSEAWDDAAEVCRRPHAHGSDDARDPSHHAHRREAAE